MSESLSMTQIRKLPSLPARADDSHKGTFGRVLIAGGCAQYVGAPALAGWAALVSGCGLVTLAIDETIAPHAISICPELTALPIRSSFAQVIDHARLASALAIGPGLGMSERADRLVMKLLPIACPKVIDADAINLLSLRRNWMSRTSGPTVLTPHPGEMARLMRLGATESIPDDDESRKAIAIEAARQFKAVIVLKGHRTIVTDGEHFYVNTTGDSSLAKAGTGDVLSGVISSLIAQGMSPLDASILGTFVHGVAGEHAGARLGKRAVLARDVIAELPSAFGQLVRRRR
jgi:NAD(P)H-hydrate epimerase